VKQKNTKPGHPFPSNLLNDEKFKITKRLLSVLLKKKENVYCSVCHNYSNNPVRSAIMDKTTILGFSGCLATITLGNFDEVLSVLAGLLTCAYMSYKIYLLAKEKKK